VNLYDIIRICHPDPKKNIALLQLMGDKKRHIKAYKRVQGIEYEETWERLRSNGMKWIEIINQIKIPHLALLRNINGIFHECELEYLQKLSRELVDGVENGKLFPFRYYTVYKSLEFQKKLLSTDKEKYLRDVLEDCIESSMIHFPILNGNTLSLCDNSGSAQGTFTSQYGKTKVSEIANLSGIMSAYNSTGRGFIGLFGDNLIMKEISKDKKILEMMTGVQELSSSIGQGTENGIWQFFQMAHLDPNDYQFDNIIIYSDMQAGHGELYGLDPNEYDGFVHNDRYIDVMKLIERYRRFVNSKVNVYMVQVAGYKNSIAPENQYRTSILSGWTGNEALYISKMNEFWDNYDKMIL
jgi:hypothetical protein